MIERLRPGDALPAQLETNCKIVRNYVLPVIVELTRQLRASCAPVDDQLPAADPPLTVAESEELTERSGSDGLQLAPNFQRCDPAALAWCGRCGPVTDANGWGFDRRTGRPCRAVGCQLGRYRAWRVAVDRSAEEQAKAEKPPAAETGPLAEAGAAMAARMSLPAEPERRYPCRRCGAALTKSTRKTHACAGRPA